MIANRTGVAHNEVTVLNVRLNVPNVRLAEVVA